MIRDTRISTGYALQGAGPFTDKEYTREFGETELGRAKILVVGAGGLGCEILKDLALSSFKEIDCIDMDTIELSNLNRQFLFREEDVGKSKAEIASRFIKQVVKDVKIQAHFNKIQDFDMEFYRQFTLIVCGLDNIEARSWINKMVVDIAMQHTQYIPLIDGGTEGFQGSVKVMIPTITACFECYKQLIPKQTTYPLCTLASMPRLPEHCIEWAHQLKWPKLYPHTKFDADDPEHVTKMYRMSLQRAKDFGIEGVTKAKTLGVVKNIIPAIASTNAVIAAACCNEAFKFITSCNPNLENIMYYNGEVGVVLASDEYHKLVDCPVCGNRPREVVITTSQITVEQFANEYVKVRFSLVEPDIFYNGGDIYNFKNGNKEDNRLLVEVIPFEENSNDGQLHSKYQLIVVDKSLQNPLKLIVKLE
ncbi:hypothetical protein FOA43_001710 [Brettanomyces nanus]|uniref:NEDD8-activating enzyme E1 catalytic subunit n=1 Tax=Eeniella nana TaxID=13502 RepID=A0A875S0F0_EENNA|nr:uncharacterized protein FOA43_001710 [Brettanomyces nanus]QPG74383.1 hypothetical protein FOA43_001710 [Brettanomyces nanus]